MAAFKDIIGQEQIKEHLQNALATGKISHAYIINGEKASGKEFIARIFAMALQCEGEGDKPCGQCHSCKQALSDNQPDIIRVTHEKPNTIGVDDIRTQVNSDIGIKPYSSKYKIYIIDEAEKMNPQAQNALLKTIEEPPSYGILMLLTTNADGFLQTILSRCITLNLRGVKTEVIKKHLMTHYQKPDYLADICATFSQGNVGKAIQLASSEEFNVLKAAVLALLKKTEELDVADISVTARELSEYKPQIDEYLDLMTMWLRDVLYYKAAEDVNNLIYKDEVFDIKKQAAKRSYYGIEEILGQIQTARTRIKANVNFELTMELLLLAIKENK